MAFNLGQLAVTLARAQEAAREREAERLKNQLIQQQMDMYKQNMANQALDAYNKEQQRKRDAEIYEREWKRQEEKDAQASMDKENERRYKEEQDRLNREEQYKLATFKAAPTAEEAYKAEKINELRQLESAYGTLNDENDPPSKGQQVVDPTTGYARYVPPAPTKRQQIAQRIAEIQGILFGGGNARRNYSSGISSLFNGGGGSNETGIGTGAVSEGGLDKNVMNRFFKNVDTGIDPNAAVEKTQAEINALMNYGATAANKQTENIKAQLRNDLALFMQGKGAMTKELFNQFLAIRMAEAEQQGVDPATIEPLIYEVLQERLAATGAARMAAPEGGQTGADYSMLEALFGVGAPPNKDGSGNWGAAGNLLGSGKTDLSGLGIAAGNIANATREMLGMKEEPEGLGMKAALTEKYLVTKMEAAKTLNELYNSVSELAEYVAPAINATYTTAAMLPAMIGAIQAYSGRGGQIGSAIGNMATTAALKMQQLLGKVVPGSGSSAKSTPQTQAEATIRSIGKDKPTFLRQGKPMPIPSPKPMPLATVPVQDVPADIAPAQVQIQRALGGPPQRLALPLRSTVNLPANNANVDYIGPGIQSGGIMYPDGYLPDIRPYPPQPGNFLNALKQAGFKIDPNIMNGGGLIAALLAMLESGQLVPEMLDGANREYLKALDERAMGL